MHLKVPSAFPNLSRFVRGFAKRIPKDKRVFKAFKKYGEFTDEQAKKALEWGTPPEIRVGELHAKIWGTTPDGADHFTLNVTMITQFEGLNWASINLTDASLTEHWQREQRRLEWEDLVARGNLAIESLILHETVHWGDGQTYEGSHPNKVMHQDPAARRAGFEDRGHQFEHAAYPGRLAFTKNDKGIMFAYKDIPGWLGTVQLEDKTWRFWQPLSQRGPAPITPPSRRARRP